MNYSELRTLLMKRFNIPQERYFSQAMRSFTLAEKTVFFFFVAIFMFSGFLLVYKVNNSFLVEVPLQGGTLTEGVLGNPRFINPALAMSEADKNVASLIYSGLVRWSQDGGIENDLASSIEISENGLEYTVVLRNDAKFHDGTPVTAYDVQFTIEKILDPDVKSPIYGNFAGVEVEALDETTAVFKLRKPYAPFVQNLSVGILPRHIWSNVSDDEFSFSQWNVLPVGSGPYRIASVERNSGGIPDYYDLVIFEESSGKKPFIEHVVFKFFPNETDLLDAFDSGEIESISGISPEDAGRIEKDGARILTSPLPRIFGVFFNQSANRVLLDKSVREALSLSAPREDIVQNVLMGFGTPITGPLQSGFVETEPEAPYEERLQKAEEVLAKGGWIRNTNGIFEKKSGSATITMSFSISTGNTPELKEVAEKVKSAWTTLGAEVDLLVYETGDLNQNVIRPRRYDALLFGEVVGRDADVYPFWHSSERNDPGLNIALYANSQVDKLLENIRAEQDSEKRKWLYVSLQEEITKDIPAVFLYSPSFLYVLPEKVKGAELGFLGKPEERFLGIRDWYIETNDVWQLFVRK